MARKRYFSNSPKSLILRRFSKPIFLDLRNFLSFHQPYYAMEEWESREVIDVYPIALSKLGGKL